MKNKLTQQYLKELFTYHNGNLYWKVNKGNRKINDKAGYFDKRYYRIRINNKQYLSHRLIFLYHNGYLPEFIDHIDGSPSNNNINNLREVTHQQNHMNQKLNKNSSSKYKGVSWHTVSKKWQVQIVINGKYKYLGYFKSEKSAALAYNKAAIKYFGEYAKLNEIKDD